MEVDQVDFLELTETCRPKKTPSGMLHLFYPLRKPSPPECPPAVSARDAGHVGQGSEGRRHSRILKLRFPLLKARPAPAKFASQMS
jgi:hypothetical protein